MISAQFNDALNLNNSREAEIKKVTFYNNTRGQPDHKFNRGFNNCQISNE